MQPSVRPDGTGQEGVSAVALMQGPRRGRGLHPTGRPVYKGFSTSPAYLLLLLLLALEPGRKGLLVLAELLRGGPRLPGPLLTAAALSHSRRRWGGLFWQRAGGFLGRELGGAWRQTPESRLRCNRNWNGKLERRSHSLGLWSHTSHLGETQGPRSGR